MLTNDSNSSPRISMFTALPTGGPFRSCSTMISAPAMVPMLSRIFFNNAIVLPPSRFSKSTKATVIFPLLLAVVLSPLLGSVAPTATLEITLSTKGFSLPMAVKTRFSAILRMLSVCFALVPVGKVKYTYVKLGSAWGKNTTPGLRIAVTTNDNINRIMVAKIVTLGRLPSNK